MVRVGGGWVALDEFLVKNDPCRGKFTLIKIMADINTLFDCYLLFKMRFFQYYILVTRNCNDFSSSAFLQSSNCYYALS